MSLLMDEQATYKYVQSIIDEIYGKDSASYLPETETETGRGTETEKEMQTHTRGDYYSQVREYYMRGDDDGYSRTTTIQFCPLKGFLSPLFKAVRRPADDLFLREFGGFLSDPSLPKKRFRDQYPGYLRKKIQMPTLKSKLVRVLLEPNCAGYFINLREHCVKANDLDFYQTAIRAAAKFAYLMISKDGLYNYSIEDRVDSQSKLLWEKLSYTMKMARTVDEVWKKAIHMLTTDKTNKYSLLTEPEIGDIVSQYYSRKCSNTCFDPPCRKRSYPRFPTEKKDEFFQDVTDAVNRMELSLSLRVDEYTRLLISIARREGDGFLDMILPSLFKDEIDIEARSKPDHSLEDFKVILCILTHRFQEEIWEQLVDVTDPLFSLICSHESLFLQPAVIEVIEVAEIRRRALGRRFIGRDLFVWAFYECGYGLPATICETVKLNTSDKDHAFSQICTATLKLATSLGVSEIELVHLVFAVFYPNYTIDEKQVTNTHKYFEAFMEEVRLDMLKRSQPSEVFPCQYEPRAIIEGLALHS